MQEKIKQLVSRLKTADRKHLAIGAGIVLTTAAVLFILFNLINKPAVEAAGQVSLLTENVRKFYQNRPDGWGISSESAVKNNIVPKAMLKDGKIINALGKEVLLGADENGNMVMPGMRSFAVVYKGLSYRECIIAAEKSLTENVQLVLNDLIVRHKDKSTEFIWGGENALPISASAAKKACGKQNTLIWSVNL